MRHSMHMIVLLYGADSYRRNKKLNELVSAYREKHKEADMLTLDLEENPDDWTRARDFLGQPSLFETSKLLAVKEFACVEEKDLPAGRRGWKAILQSYIDDRRTFIFLSQADAPKKAFQFLLKDPVAVQAFEELSGASLELFLKREAKEREIVFTSDGFRFFCSYISGCKEKSWQGIRELEKISLADFASPIRSSDIQTAIHYEEREAVFALARKIIFSADAPSRLFLLERLLHAADSAYAFNSLAYQARGKSLERFADYDVAVKSGKLEYEEALTDFVLATSG